MITSHARIFNELHSVRLSVCVYLYLSLWLFQSTDLYELAVRISIDKNKEVRRVRIATYIGVRRSLGRLHYAYNTRPCSILAMGRGVACGPLVGAIRSRLRHGPSIPEPRNLPVGISFVLSLDTIV